MKIVFMGTPDIAGTVPGRHSERGAARGVRRVYAGR